MVSQRKEEKIKEKIAQGRDGMKRSNGIYEKVRLSQKLGEVCKIQV